MITDRDIAILSALAKYYVLSRPQIQRLCFESDVSGRVTRRRLQRKRTVNHILTLSLFWEGFGLPFREWRSEQWIRFQSVRFGVRRKSRIGVVT